MNKTPALFLLLVLCTGTAAEDQKPVYLIVTRSMFEKSLQSLVEHRKKDGFEVILSTKTVAQSLKETEKVDYLLIVGDCETGRNNSPWHIETRHIKRYRWQQSQKSIFASDAAFADRNGDYLPDFPVGRIPARKPSELELVTGKIIAWETRKPSRRDLRLSFWAGSPMYGAAIDAAATEMGLSVLRQHGPQWVEPSVLTADRRYALCGWPEDQPEHFARWMIRGGYVTVLMGHGNATSMYSMKHDGNTVRFTAEKAADILQQCSVCPPLLIFTCTGGKFDGRTPCLAERLLFTKGGPVAAIGATEESHPLPNYHSGVAALKLIKNGPRRIGDYWLDTAKKTITARNFLIEMLLARVESSRGMKTDPRKLNRDQGLLYAVMGDPATKLRVILPLKVEIQQDDNGWKWSVEKPANCGRLVLEHSSISPQHGAAENIEDRQACNQAFEKANAVLGFSSLIEIPPDKPWSGTIERPGRVRFICITEKDIAVHATDLKKPPAPVTD